MNPLSDIGLSLLRVRIWMSLAISDVAGKYRRTVLGPLWIVLGQVAVIIGIYLLRHSISPSVIGNFLLYLAASLPVWGLVSSMTSDGTSALSRSKSLIDSYALPMTVFLLRSIASIVINFLHTIIVFFVIAAIYWEFPAPESFPWFFMGLAIVIVFGLGMHLLLAPLSARYRDIAPALGSFMTIAYIMSPVFWVVAPGQGRMLLVKFNPFYYLLDITRGPLLNQVPPLSTYYVGAFIALVALWLGVMTFRRLGPRVVFWL
jgi:ABC-type polysaccharide/polyol phosphate export permease